MDDNMNKLKEIFDKEGIDALFITKTANQRYLEDFTGLDCFLIVSPEKNFLIADSRYIEMAGKECRTAEVVPHRAPNPPLPDVLAGIARNNGYNKLGFEKDHISWGMYNAISQKTGSETELVPTSMLVEGMRAIKTPKETNMIETSCKIADRALAGVLPLIKQGISELDLKIELDYRLKTGGAEDVSFETMALFGARTSQPHANSRRDVRLKNGDFVLVDFGACTDGYRSDMTRTFICGGASDEKKKAYGTVLQSQLACLEMISPGTNGRDINDKALGIIRGEGLPAFEYGIGHGVGLEIHEEPFLRQNTDVTLAADMVLTIEPGMYKPGWGGIRIEDTVLVTSDGCAALTRFPKELIEL
jgi:Xaa-Pro aminopeptidase